MEKNKNSTRTKIRPSRSVSVTVNDLPDDILCHILCFLPIKEAFRTTILSKRWSPLCYSLSVLHFESNDIRRMDWIDLRQLVNKVMFSPCSQHVTLKSFHLDCRYTSKPWNYDYMADCLTFHNWVEEAKRRRLEELRLFSLPGIPLKPTTFFCSKTLVVLELRWYSVVSLSPMFHCSVDLPLLKSLYLGYVKFQDMEDFMKLLSGCPILENLETHHDTETSGVTLEGYYKPLSKLITADIQLFRVPFATLCNVKFLTIWSCKMEGISSEEINSYYKDFPVFENLTKLQLYFFRRISNWEWDEGVKMLQNCPKLQTLIIRKAWKLTTREDWKYPDHVPECVSSHLTTCKIIDYEATKADIQFATYILQNASLLQVMEIGCLSDQFFEDLVSCPRISPACKLIRCRTP